MSCVIDASFVAAMFLPDEQSERCMRFAERLEEVEATAPGLLQLEVTNILLVANRRKRITGAQLNQLSEAYDQLPIVLHPALTPAQRQAVLRLASAHNLTAYDAAYLELAMRLGASFASLDDRLLSAAASEGVRAAL
jgi:predicted nucleic acid-binding protein